MSGLIKRKTQKMRYSIARKIAPSLYENSQHYNDIIIHMPRPMILEAKKRFAGKPSLNAAEIGVAQGDNSLSMLKELTLGTLWLIDPYGQYGAMGDCEIAKNKVSVYQQVKWVIKTSSEAVKEIDLPLDLVYIDGNHDYEYVKQDIELYYPLVKSGGIIGGHDFQNYWSGVIRAANEFSEQKNLKINIYPPDWWIIKP